MSVLVVGELNVDLVLQNYQTFPSLGKEVLVENLSLTMGSASAICAAGIARLGTPVGFVGKVGCDAWGDLVLNRLRELGVDVTYVMRRPEITTGITVSISSPTDRAMVTYLGSIESLLESEVETAWFTGWRHLHVASFFLQRKLRPHVRQLLARAKAAGLTTSLDPGCDPEERWGQDLVDALMDVDLFFPNEVELAGVTGESDPERALQKLQNGRTTTVAKLGSKGAIAVEPSGQVTTMPAFRVVPVDTTGAGDSFNAGFLHAWLKGRTIEESMRFAAACGAISTQGIGGTTAQASEAEAEAWLAEWAG